MQKTYCGFLGEGRSCVLPSWYTWIAQDTSCEMHSNTSEGNFTLVKCFVMWVENMLVSAVEDGSGRQRRLKKEAGHKDRCTFRSLYTKNMETRQTKHLDINTF